MFSLTSSSSARYLVFEQITRADGTTNLFKMFCANIADARKCAAHNWARWQRIPNAKFYLEPANGFKAFAVPAGVVKAQSKRYGRYQVAKAFFSGGTAVLGIIAL